LWLLIWGLRRGPKAKEVLDALEHRREREAENFEKRTATVDPDARVLIPVI
jgi:hypothetical protein